MFVKLFRFIVVGLFRVLRAHTDILGNAGLVSHSESDKEIDVSFMSVFSSV